MLENTMFWDLQETGAKQISSPHNPQPPKPQKPKTPRPLNQTQQ